jgi:hypothetical protein
MSFYNKNSNYPVETGNLNNPYPVSTGKSGNPYPVSTGKSGNPVVLEFKVDDPSVNKYFTDEYTIIFLETKKEIKVSTLTTCFCWPETCNGCHKDKLIPYSEVYYTFRIGILH